MSDLATAPAGWYPDPSGSGQRWWDGRQWTGYATPLDPPPYGTVAQARVAEGTPVHTPWIWLLLLIPVLAGLPVFGWDLESYLMESASGSASATVTPLLDPWYLLAIVFGWIGYGLTVWFAYLDSAALRRLGYARRFHWAWAFLSFLVYVIGRSVVVKRQAGHGTAPMWVGIALMVAYLIAVTTWMFVVIAEVVNTTIATTGF